MSASPLWDRVKNGPDISFTGSLLVTAEIEHLADGGIGLLCRQIEAGSPEADVMLTSSIAHWSAPVLACARPGDVVSVAGRAEPIDGAPGQDRPLLRINNPARLEIWTRIAAGPDPTSKTPFRGTAA